MEKTVCPNCGYKIEADADDLNELHYDLLGKKVNALIKIQMALGDLKLVYIITKKRELKLRGSIDVSVVLEEDGWVFAYPELNIISCGETYHDTLESFQEDFIELFEHYALGDPKPCPFFSLNTGNALEIRKIFERLVVQ